MAQSSRVGCGALDYLAYRNAPSKILGETIRRPNLFVERYHAATLNSVFFFSTFPPPMPRSPTEASVPSLSIVTNSMDIFDQYRIVRLFQPKQKELLGVLDEGVGCSNEELLKVLDEGVGSLNEVPSLELLKDGSFEMIVLQSYCSTLQKEVGRLLPDFSVDLHYDPTKPMQNDVEHFGYEQAEMLTRNRFRERAQRMEKKSWNIATTFYSSLLKMHEDAEQVPAPILCVTGESNTIIGSV